MLRDEDASPRGSATGHVPVLLRTVVDLLQPAPGRKYLDGTFGGGGHTRALLEAGAEVIALDCDPAARARAEELTTLYPGRLHFLDTRFNRLEGIEGAFHGALFDFGVSSFQLDDSTRGFSFLRDGPTDMRLDPRQGPTAAEFLETASRGELVHAVRDLGEEPEWRRVVEALVRARGTGRLGRTASLAEIVSAALPPQRRYGSKIHPATRTFQGIRMAVNEELPAIEAALPAAFARLAPSGVLVAISFHSLEDRIVKRIFRRLCGQPESVDDARPADIRLASAVAEPLTRRPVVPEEAEVLANLRSRSARLRAVRRLPF